MGAGLPDLFADLRLVMCSPRQESGHPEAAARLHPVDVPSAGGLPSGSPPAR
jgi:hypothetical protein